MNKVVSCFATTATAHGGQESTILAMNNVAYHWGCIIVGPGYIEPSQFQSGNPYGASHTSANGQIPPDEGGGTDRIRAEPAGDLVHGLLGFAP